MAASMPNKPGVADRCLDGPLKHRFVNVMPSLFLRAGAENDSSFNGNSDAVNLPEVAKPAEPASRRPSTAGCRLASMSG